MTEALKPLKNDKGMAMIEALPLMIIFVIFVGYGLGMFGTIHTSILNSIAARAYAFETFRNRTNLTVFRENNADPQHYRDHQMRFHGIQPDYAIDIPITEFKGTPRPIAVGMPVESIKSSTEDHNKKIFELDQRNLKVSTSPVWVMVGYGICLTANCGD